MAISVIGAKHERRGQECEDASDAESIADHLEVVALSDGHGSENAPRSHIGARFAVESAIEVIEETASEISLPENEEEGSGDDPQRSITARFPWGLFGKEEVEEDRRESKEKAGVFERVFRREMEGNSRLVRRVIGRWRDKIDNDLGCEGPKKGEEDKISEVKQEEGVNYKKYGSTLLVAVTGEGYRFFFKIGDGDILSIPPVSERGNKDTDTFWVFSPEDENVGEQTYSLSMQAPEKFAETKFISSRKSRRSDPPFLLLCTDGYRNSFTNDDDFLEAAREFRDFFLSDEVGKAISEGFHQALKKQLDRWLTDTSERGSGDDISLGVLFDLEYSGITETDFSFDPESG